MWRPHESLVGDHRPDGILTNAGGAVMFLALGVGGRGQLLRLPGLYLMGGTAILAWLGIA